MSSGITVSATDIEIDDNKKIVTVTNGSIINGAQTQGEIKLYLDEIFQEPSEEPQFHARVEFIVDPDKEFIVGTAIARNTSTNIQRISMAGKKKYLDELNLSFKKIFEDRELSKSETDTGEEFVSTERVLQVLWAMMPENLLPKSKRTVSEARLKSYKNRAFCLMDFEQDFVKKGEGDAEAIARYRYFVDMVGIGWKEYLKWRHHKGWSGLYLKEHTRAIRRSPNAPNGHTVADGIVFPILSAMSYFVAEDSKTGKWDLLVPRFFVEQEMIQAARDQLTAHSGDPIMMGRTAAVYESLSLLPKMVLRLSERVGASN